MRCTRQVADRTHDRHHRAVLLPVLLVLLIFLKLLARQKFGLLRAITKTQQALTKGAGMAKLHLHG